MIESIDKHLYKFSQTTINTDFLKSLFDKVKELSRVKKLGIDATVEKFDDSDNDHLLGGIPFSIRPGFLYLKHWGYLEFSEFTNVVDFTDIEKAQLQHLCIPDLVLRVGYNLVKPNAIIKLHSDKETPGVGKSHGRYHNFLTPLFNKPYQMEFDGHTEIVESGQSILLNTTDLHGLTNIYDEPLVFFHWFYSTPDTPEFELSWQELKDIADKIKD
jgi:hypothetical protein